MSGTPLNSFIERLKEKEKQAEKRARERGPSFDMQYDEMAEVLSKLGEKGLTVEQVKSLIPDDPQTKKLAEELGYLDTRSGTTEGGQLKSFVRLVETALDLGKASVFNKTDATAPSFINPDKWECGHCGEDIETMRGKRPTICPNPNCGKKGPFIALSGPYLYFKITPFGTSFVPEKLGEAIKKEIRFATMRDNEDIYFYRGGVYNENGEVLIKEEARKKLGPLARENHVNETIAHIRETTYVDRKQFDNPSTVIAVENGLLDVLTGKLQPHTPDKLIIVKLPVSYDKKADCPKIKKFLSEIHHAEDMRTVQEMVGYCLLREYPFAKAFMLLGAGSNGKSTELRLITSLLGNENTSSPSLYDLLTDRFAGVELFQKMANIHADIPVIQLKYTGLFKMLTGQDDIRGQRKHRDPFKFLNYAKLLFSANELPGTDDRTFAFFRRWILIDYPNVFPEDDPKTDPYLLKKLTTPGELSGFLNWALKGLHRLLKRRRFTRTGPMKNVENEWIMQTDSLRSFANTHVRVKIGKFVVKSDFYERLKAFCTEHEIECPTMSVVGRRLPTIIPQTGEFYPKIGGKQVKSWKDIYITDMTEKSTYLFAETKTANTVKISEKKGHIGSDSETPEHWDMTGEKGEKRSQRANVRRVMGIIKDLEDQHGGAAPFEEIKRIAKSEGITESFVNELVLQEKQRGHLYEPKEGMITRAVK